VGEAPAKRSRPGWIREVELPRDLDELRGPTSGRIRLPLRLYWSGPDPQSVEWDAGCEADRRWLYEIVLREGNLEEQRVLVNGAELARLWDVLYLPPHLKLVWQPLIDAARLAA